MCLNCLCLLQSLSEIKSYVKQILPHSFSNPSLGIFLFSKTKMSETCHLNFIDSCRMCARKTKNLQNLYQSDEHGKTLAQKIKECLSLSFYEFELRPKCICLKCVSKLNTVYEFYQLIKESDEIFKKIVATKFITKPEADTAEDEFKDLKPLILTNTQHCVTKIQPIKINAATGKREDKLELKVFHEQQHVFVNEINPDLERLWRQKLGILTKAHKKPTATIVKRRRQLTNHSADKYLAKEFECFDCKSAFPSVGKLRAHVRELHEATIECRICMKSFTRHAYIQHLCGDGNEMECQYCDKKFNATVALVKHINQQHKNHHNYKCYDCARAFKTKALLEIHRPTHDTEEKRFVCDICDERFRTRYQIKEHIETTHTDKRCKEQQISSRIFCLFIRFSSSSFEMKHTCAKHVARTFLMSPIGESM